MHIEIDDQYAIGSDKYQFILKKKSRVKNKETGLMEDGWVADSFFPTIAGLTNYLIQQSLRDSEATTLNDALEDVKRTSIALELALTPKFKVELAA